MAQPPIKRRGRDIASTFSDMWYRVGPTTPRLSAHARVVRQHYGPTIAYVVEDPASGQFYRMSESAHFFLGMLDGRTTVDQAWEACNDQLGDAAPTQREVIDLLSRLQLFGLVLGESALDAEMLEQRLTKAKRQRTQKRTGKWMFPHVPIVNPEPFLRRHEKLCRVLFGRTAGVLWIILVSIALVLVFANVHRFGDELNKVAQLSASTIATLGVIFLVLRVVHELGHAMACKAFGGRSTEIGVILIAYVMPLPYCDASSAWRFARVWPRVCVSLAGILAETVLAALAVVYWAFGSDPVWTSIAYQVMLVSGVSTLVFNLNPLLRYDGYYILSDLTGTPNLAQRSREMLKYLIQYYAYGVKGSRGPSLRSLGEGWLLAVYGLLATPYRVFIAIAILLIIASKYLTLGVALAVAMGAIWLVYPIFKTAGFLLSDPKLEGHRARALSVTLAALAVVIGPIMLAPLPTPTYAVATIEPARMDGLRTLEGGILAELLVDPGDAVEEGQIVARLENRGLQAELEATRARLAQAQTQYRTSLKGPAAEQEEFRQAVRVVEEQLARAERRVANLRVLAPVSGVVSPLSEQTSADLRSRIGAWVPRGTALGMVVSEGDLVVRAMVPDRDHAFVFRGQDESEINARVRLASAPGDVIKAGVLRTAPLGSKELTSPSLASQSGGGITTDPRTTDRAIALTPSFVVDLRLAKLTPGTVPGVRASVRLEGPNRPLGVRWWRRASPVLRGASVVVGGTPSVTTAPGADRLWPALSREERREEPLEGVDRVAANLQGRVIRRRVSTHERDLAGAILDTARACQDLTEASLGERIDAVRQHAHRIARQDSKLDSDALREAYAVGVEAVRRTTGLTLYPEQVMGALVLRGGAVAEMATGEGKTVTAILPAALAGWTGRGVHVATVNDYLAKRDAQLCESAYARLGLRVGVLEEGMKKADRRAQYDLDITYGADKQFIFDFLRDRLSQPLSPSVAGSVLDAVTHEDDRQAWTNDVVQRGLHAAIVDEADSVLIDEAATPAIIALPAGDGIGADSAERYAAGIELARELEPDRHYKADARTHRVSLTRAGHEKLGELAADPNRNLPAFWAGPRRREELVSQALSAIVLHRRDDDYIVRPNKEGKREVVIVDRSTGRVLEGRQWQLGLHQAVEVKEGLDPSERRHTAARVSYQRYFARYRSLAGMTGTGWEVAPELWRTYNLRVVRVPTHRPIARVERADRTFATEDEKFAAVAKATRRAHDKSQPVLVGSRSVHDSERLAGLLAEQGLECKVLNARHEAEEAAIIEGAGRAGAITVATSMAGRGTDIKLDDDAREAGGLLVLAVERNHERRVDRQLFGRSGRQGDVGEAVAFVSLDDEMVVRYGLPPLRWLTRVSPDPVRSTLTRLLVRQAQRAATRRWMLIREEAGRIDAWVDLAFHQRSR